MESKKYSRCTGVLLILLCAYLRQIALKLRPETFKVVKPYRTTGLLSPGISRIREPINFQLLKA